ncbi:MAG: hypothetical protein EPN60_06940 [Nevskiaceae bacterium]|nr:MAG: hypothetical protein EPO48_15125 [Nevskiaceae bacterium]TAM28734.1 MAG: hypothetical protein EPN60_06940 [Nevskiaceae bacterium]
MRNFARFLQSEEHVELFRWCLALHRRVLREDRSRTYEAMHQFFQNMQVSDERWTNIFQMTNPLGPGAAPQDVAFQLFETIDGVAEGCFKPQLQIIYAFAVRDATGAWPRDVRTLDFGTLVENFPAKLRTEVPVLLRDEDLRIRVHQWRNIAAHKSFKLIGPRTVEVTYGKGNPRTSRFGLQRLRSVSKWLIQTHSAARLANTITYVEHMRELVALGKPNTERPLSATLVVVGHGLSTVGFEVVGWDVIRREGRMTVLDRLNREPKGALIHASQQLVALSIGILSDVASRSRIDRVSIQLNFPDGEVFGTARVAVSDADAFSLRKINLEIYLDRIQWAFGALK